jgi:hypothetical protein
VPADREHDWHHPWLRINVLVREMARLAARDRSTRPILKVELNKAISIRAKMKSHIWWN